jgi:hypothetical protein
MKSYLRTNWVDNVTPVNACNLNKIETALFRLACGKLESGDIVEGDGIKIDVVDGKLVISLTENNFMDYSEMINKPSINGVELNGDLSTEDLGINTLTDSDIAKFYDLIENFNLETIETEEDGFFIVDERMNIGVSVSPEGEFNTGYISDDLLTKIKREINVWE